MKLKVNLQVIITYKFVYTNFIKIKIKMEQKKDYVVVNIPTTYSYSPQYSVPYNAPYNAPYSAPYSPPSTPYNYSKPTYNNLTYRRRAINKPLCNHSIYDRKDNIITKKNENQCCINFTSFDTINTGSIGFQNGNDNDNDNGNDSKKSNLSKCTTLIKNFLGQQNIVNDDNQFINV